MCVCAHEARSFRPMQRLPYGLPIECVIERKRSPTGNIPQQPNQSPNRQVHKTNTSHAAEVCRLRAGRRASSRVRRSAGRVSRDTPLCAPGDAPFCAPGYAPFCAPGDAPFCAPGDAPVARREARRLRVGRRAGCASRARAEDVPDARRVRARARPFLLRGGGRRLEAVVVRQKPEGG